MYSLKNVEWLSLGLRRFAEMLRQRDAAHCHLLCASQSHQTRHSESCVERLRRVEELPSVSDEVFDEFAL